MTITEQLQFSVLTAPVAMLDRRSLSQAWYSALYGAGGCAKSATVKAPNAKTLGGELNGAHTGTHETASRLSRAGTTVEAASKTADRSQGIPAERRAPRSALARKIERAFLRPRCASKKSSFTAEGEHGRVHVLLQSRGTQLKLVAICPEAARRQVADALAQARYSLAKRGIDLDTDTRSAAAC
ncbi:MAG TPA: hypothetical protein VKT72_04700 [Candidatus Baltobacteraceae bacterium]|nr:hypothetical protein [Candidatus Baltobacteraceae bacterium]